MKVVPILVGALGAENEAMYGKLLAKYIDDPQNFFSVSSDFCHWGSRYVGFSLSVFINIILLFSINLIFVVNAQDVFPCILATSFIIPATYPTS